MKKAFIFLVNIFLFLFVVLAPFVMLYVEKKVVAFDYKPNIILNLWHVDSFEGSSPVKNFLEKSAINFNKQNKNVFIMVKTLTNKELELTIESGQKPDIISFGKLAGETVFSSLNAIDKGIPVRADLKKGGIVNEELLAVPYTTSAYFLVTKDENNFATIFENGQKLKNHITYSVVASNKDLAVVNFALGEEFENKNIIDETSYYESEFALSMFKKNQAKILVAKPKDIINLRNTTSEEFFIKPLEAFCDMTQYIGMVNKTFENEIESFVNFLITEKCQSELIKYNLFNVINKNFYGSSGMAELESSVNKMKKTISPFMSTQNFQELKNCALKYLQNEKEVLEKINNFII